MAGIRRIKMYIVKGYNFKILDPSKLFQMSHDSTWTSTCGHKSVYMRVHVHALPEGSTKCMRTEWSQSERSGRLRKFKNYILLRYKFSLKLKKKKKLKKIYRGIQRN